MRSLSRTIGLFAALAVSLTACEAGRSPKELVTTADARLRAGGLELPAVRVEMRSLYGEALRRVDRAGLTAADEAWVRSHAHFGLAMNRIWDLADRVLEVLEEGGVLAALRGEGDSESGRPAYCALFESFDALESLIKILLDTALVPVVVDLRAAVTADPNLTVVIDRATYDLSALSSERGLPNTLDLSATYGGPDVLFLLGVVGLAAGAAEGSFAWRDLLPNLFLFSFAAASPIDGQDAKVFNSNPCVDRAEDGNPLLNPDFGVLQPGGAEALARSATLIRAALVDLAASFGRIDEQPASGHWVGSDSDGTWGTGILTGPAGRSRLELQVPSGSDNILSAVMAFEALARAFLSNLTPQIDADSVAATLQALAASIDGRGLWDMRASLRPIVPAGNLGALVATIKGTSSNLGALDEYEAVHLDLSRLFVQPPGDLKALVPMFYLEDESFTDADGNGRRNHETAPVRKDADYASTEPFVDINCNGRWDQRGDLVLQPEHEPYIDENESGAREASETRPVANAQPHTLGIIGTFVDIDANGIPDRPTVDGVSGASPVGVGRFCAAEAPVTWPASVGDPDYGAFPLGLTDPTDNAPYGEPITRPEIVALAYEDGLALGPVLGHYWPSPLFSVGDWPASARRDAANGTVDPSYMFFPDPTFGGIIQRDAAGTADAAGTTNAWLNRFLTQWSRLTSELGI